MKADETLVRAASPPLSLASIDYTTTIVTSIFILSVYHYYTNIFSYFKRRGIKGPTPWPLVGNLLPLMFGNRYSVERKRSEKYGKFYGVFYGTKPRYVVNDPEVLRQICIKDFNAMPNHSISAFLNEYQKYSIFFMRDDKWRRLRTLQSPTFTSGKIKRMYRLLSRCADDLVANFSERLAESDNKAGQLVNIKDIFLLYTMDGITNAAYSIKLERSGCDLESASSRNEFVRLAMRIFNQSIPRVLISMVLPERILLLLGFSMSPQNDRKELANRLQPIIEQRRNQTRKADDYLQILVDARMDDRLELDEMDEKENHHAGLSQESIQADRESILKSMGQLQNGPQVNGASQEVGSPPKTKLTDFEVLASAVFLLLVGLETTGNLLANCIYALAFHPDVQEKVYQTIKSIAEFNAETDEYTFDYERLTSCEYLDAVVSESLRILTPVVMLDREVSQDYYLEKYNVQLRKGDKLNLAFWAIMNNPEFWTDPSKFDPERFVGDNKKNIVPGSYCPFGLGPRHCLGMRFSLTEAKLALAKVLMRFKFTPAPNTSFPPEGKPHLNLTSLKRPFVVLSARS